MKNKKMVLWIALVVMAIIPVYAQQYDSEKDFKIDWDENVKDGVVITKYIGAKREVSIPPKIQNDPVTGIGAYAFKFNENITKVNIPNSVTRIGYDAFSGCTRLANVTIPDRVIIMGEGAFESCTSLTTISIPSSVTSMVKAFSNCTNLTKVIIGDGITIIDNGAFSNCTSLTSVNIPNVVTFIGSSAFSGCTRLANVNIPNGVTIIGSSAFSGCTRLANVTIPSSVTLIGSSAFVRCENLTSITFEGIISSENLKMSYVTSPFDGDLRDKYLASDGGPGIYTRFAGGNVWRKTSSITPPPTGNLGAFTIRMKDNFENAQGYEALIVNANLLNGHRITKGETYTLKVTYTTSRDLEGPVLVRLVDTSFQANWWRDLTPGDDSKFQIAASKAGEVVSVTVTLNTIESSTTGSNPESIVVVFTTNGEGIKGKQDSGVQKPFNIVFTEFVLTRIK